MDDGHGNMQYDSCGCLWVCIRFEAGCFGRLHKNGRLIPGQAEYEDAKIAFMTTIMYFLSSYIT